MIRTVINHPGVGEFVAERANALYTHGHDVTFGTMRGDELLGGAILTNFTGATCLVHVAGDDPHWLTRDLLWIVFHYPFVQLDLHTMYAMVNSSNTDSLRFNQRLGFRTEAVLRHAYPNGDMIITALPRTRCRFLNIKPRQFRAGGSHGR